VLDLKNDRALGELGDDIAKVWALVRAAAEVIGASADIPKIEFGAQIVPWFQGAPTERRPTRGTEVSMAKAPKAPKVEIQGIPDDGLYIVVDGVKIAKRGERGTTQGKTWVSLEPGWSVLDGPGGKTLEELLSSVLLTILL
jgi:hypothetical protein